MLGLQYVNEPDYQRDELNTFNVWDCLMQGAKIALSIQLGFHS